MAGDYWQDNACPLDQPQPVLKNGTFKLDGEKGSASENIRLSPDTVLVIESRGCEYATSTYRFTTHLAPAEKQTSGIEYRKAIELLGTVGQRAELTLDLAAAGKTLQSYLALVAEPKLSEQLYIRNDPETQFSEKVWVEADRDSEPFWLSVTLSSGPY